MPFASQKQRAFLHMKEPAMAARWEAEAKAHKKPAVQPHRKRKKKDKATGTAANVLMGNHVAQVNKRITTAQARKTLREGRKARQRVQMQHALWELNAATKQARKAEKYARVPLSTSLYRTADMDRAIGRLVIGKRRRPRGRKVGKQELELLRQAGVSTRALSDEERRIIRRAHRGEQAGVGGSLATAMEPYASRWAKQNIRVRGHRAPHSFGVPVAGGWALGAGASRGYVPPRTGVTGVKVVRAGAGTRAKKLAKPVVSGAVVGGLTGGLKNTLVVPGMLYRMKYDPNAREAILTRFTAKTVKNMGRGALGGAGAGLAYALPRAATAYDIRLDLNSPQGAWVQGAFA